MAQTSAQSSQQQDAPLDACNYFIRLLHKNYDYTNSIKAKWSDKVKYSQLNAIGENQIAFAIIEDFSNVVFFEESTDSLSLKSGNEYYNVSTVVQTTTEPKRTASSTSACRNVQAISLIYLSIPFDDGTKLWFLISSSPDELIFLKPEAIEINVGLPIELNPSSINEIFMSQSFSPLDHITKNQKADGSTQSDFDKAIGFHLKDVYTPKNVDKNVMVFTGPAEKKELQNICWWSYMASYIILKFRENFTNIKNIGYLEIKDTHLNADLDNKLVSTLDRILKNNIPIPPEMHLFWPLFQKSHKFMYIYGAPPNGTVHDTLILAEYIHLLRYDLTNSLHPRPLVYQPTYLTDHKIELVGRHDQFRSIKECLCYEIDNDETGGIYIHFYGKWYDLTRGHIQALLKEYTEIKISELFFTEETSRFFKKPQEYTFLAANIKEFEQAKGEKEYLEAWYNKYIASQDQRFLCLDRANVNLGNRQLLELCDLLSIDKHLIHVKINRGTSISSETLAYLFHQGVASSELLSCTRIFRQKAREVIAKISAKATRDIQIQSMFNNVIQLNGFNASDYTVVFAIICERKPQDTDKYPMPISSLIALKKAVDHIKTFGYSVKLIWIPLVTNGPSISDHTKTTSYSATPEKRPRIY